MITGKIKQAIHDANKAHSRLKHKHGELSYIVHLVEVMGVLIEHGITNEKMLCASILHDIVEDTDWTYDDVLHEYGPEVADLVASVTDDSRLSRQQQLKQQIENCAKKNPEQLCLKLADRIAKLRAGPGCRTPGQSRLKHSEALVDAARERMHNLGFDVKNEHPFWFLLATLSALVTKLSS